MNYTSQTQIFPFLETTKAADEDKWGEVKEHVNNTVCYHKQAKQGRLAGSVLGARDSRSPGCEFEPQNGCSDYLKNKIFKSKEGRKKEEREGRKNKP